MLKGFENEDRARTCYMNTTLYQKTNGILKNLNVKYDVEAAKWEFYGNDYNSIHSPF